MDYRRMNSRRRQIFLSILVLACLSNVFISAAADQAQTSMDAQVLNVSKAIDELILGRLKTENMEPAPICSDPVFVRRVYLDVIGTLPTVAEVKRFLEDTQSDKRSRLIEDLLGREEFADYWSLKWCDLLRVKSEFPINLWPNAVQAYHRWVRDSIKKNKPYDLFVREMLTSSGSNFRVPPVNFFRAIQGREPESIARAVALTFMGSRIEAWPKEQAEGLAAFFRCVHYKRTAEWKEEIVYVDLIGAFSEAGELRRTVFPDGVAVDLEPNTDHRLLFVDWLVGEENPWFAKNVVNRIWYWLMGVGIIMEPDDIRTANPPTHPKLLNLLEKELVNNRYDLKHIYRIILNSSTYQQSSMPGGEASGAGTLFSSYSIRRLDAEVLIDAICKVTGTRETYSSLIPEPYTFIPTDQPTISLADGSITSSFLELFGRPTRDTGLESERNNTPSASQELHLLNSTHIREKIEACVKGVSGWKAGPIPEDVIRTAYLRILSRYPSDEEVSTVREYAENSEANGEEVLTDLIWALINTSEFLCRH